MTYDNAQQIWPIGQRAAAHTIAHTIDGHGGHRSKGSGESLYKGGSCGRHQLMLEAGIVDRYPFQQGDGGGRWNRYSTVVGFNKSGA